MAAAGLEPDRSCLEKINVAVTLADAMPNSPGRGAVLTDIARARDSLHEGQEADCQEQIDETLTLLRNQSKTAASQDKAVVKSE